MVIAKIDNSNRGAVNSFILKNWYTTKMVVRGKEYDLSKASGAVAFEDENIIGLVTYIIYDDTLEILSLDSVRENKGTGTALLQEAINSAKEIGCKRVAVITTNDNINAIRFYQKRGFDMIKLHYGAVGKARLLKPEIPLVAQNGIPITHELEFEMKL